MRTLTSVEDHQIWNLFANLAMELNNHEKCHIALRELWDDTYHEYIIRTLRNAEIPAFNDFVVYNNVYRSLHAIENFVEKHTGNSFKSPIAKQLTDQLEKIITMLEDFGDALIVYAAIKSGHPTEFSESTSLVPDRASKLGETIHEIGMFIAYVSLMCEEVA